MIDRRKFFSWLGLAPAGTVIAQSNAAIPPNVPRTDGPKCARCGSPFYYEKTVIEHVMLLSSGRESINTQATATPQFHQEKTCAWCQSPWKVGAYLTEGR